MLLSNAFDPDPRVHQEAASLVKNGYDVTILCWDRDYKQVPFEIIDGIGVERIYVRSTHGRGTTQMLFLFAFWLKAFVRGLSKRFDVVHCHDFDTLPLGYALSVLKKAKLVYDSHESYIDMLGNIPACLKKAIYRTESFLLKRADMLITVGEILRQSFQARGAKNTCVVGNWKDSSQFQFPQEDLKAERERLNISDDTLVVSFIANLGYERQIPQLIEAVAGLPETALMIGGKGSCQAMAEQASRQFSNVRYLGYVHPSKVPFYTAVSDVVFYGFDPQNPNSRYSAPNKLFEALASGKAVLTGDFGEISRIVREEQCGIVLASYTVEDIKKALSSLMTIGLGEFTRNSRHASEHKYSWQKASQVLIQSYRQLG